MQLEDLEAWARGAGALTPTRAAPRRPRRIIPVSSGKGGVGKTTFALNFALELSRHGRTVLVDLDTGTSSVRHCIDAPVARDLYHFFRRDVPLCECVTALPARLDPQGEHSAFGFVAAPSHYIEEIARFDAPLRERLMAAVNALDADFVVLDLRAGLDLGVLAFLPPSNSGVLVFTPHHPAAALAAADMVRALLLRKLRALLAPGSALYAALPGVAPELPLELLARTEDVYDDGLRNFDDFLAALRELLGPQPALRALQAAVDSFVVHFALNMFDGVQESHERALRPLVEHLSAHASEHLTLLNLGWIVRHGDFDAAARERVPALLRRAAPAAPAEPPARPDRATAELQRLALYYRGVNPPPRRDRKVAAAFAGAVGGVPPSGVARHVEAQLDLFVRMHAGLRGASWRDNFRYVAARALHLLRSRRASEFGDVRLYRDEELATGFRAPA